jgi:hypothetical protein
MLVLFSSDYCNTNFASTDCTIFRETSFVIPQGQFNVEIIKAKREHISDDSRFIILIIFYFGYCNVNLPA